MVFIYEKQEGLYILNRKMVR